MRSLMSSRFDPQILAHKQTPPKIAAPPFPTNTPQTSAAPATLEAGVATAFPICGAALGLLASPEVDEAHIYQTLLARLGLSSGYLYRVQFMAAIWNPPVHKATLASGQISARCYCRTMAALFGFRVLDQRAACVAKLDPRLPYAPPWQMLKAPVVVRLAAPEPLAALNAQSASPTLFAQLAEALGPERRRVALISRQTMIDAIISGYGRVLARTATWELRKRFPQQSAADGPRYWQLLAIAGIIGIFTGAAAIAFRETLLVASAILSLFFLLSVSLRLLAAMRLIRERFRRGHIEPAFPMIPHNPPEGALPVYTILVPLFRETKILPDLIAALSALDYPAARLDIKLILEEVDTETIAAVKATRLPSPFDIIIVPDRSPRTKPKACNFALQFATGDYAVIYDAEDRPAPDQLRKAVAAFASAPPDVICLQARLNFYNPDENWLAKQFTIEYSSLFSGILPTLDCLDLPILLGGTSNHFRMQALRELGGWDAFNVTEDADLGIRIYRAGYRSAMLDSTTYEEAACQFGNWLRQRTRWLKGWMQTYAVHMRDPRGLRADLGWRGFIAFQALFAAILVSVLTHPLFYVLFAYDLTHGGVLRGAQSVLGAQFWVIATFNLVAGYAAATVLGVVSMRMRGVVGLIPQILSIPIYWLAISLAAYRALYQFFANPFYWEKTNHGASRGNAHKQH